MRATSIRLLGLFCFLVLLGGCNPSDAGSCCKVLNGDESLIPQPEFNSMNDPRDVVSQHPQFDCSGLVCASYRGSPAFCTHKCADADDCPEGFACEPLLQSDPPEGSQLKRNDRFCVKQLDACIE